MRLIDFGQKEDYIPLERGIAFPQEYENGDTYKWYNPMCFNYKYWLEMIQRSEFEVGFKMSKYTLAEALMMGGEL